MATPAKLLGDLCHVHIAFRTQARTINAPRAFLEESGSRHLADGERIIHETVGIFFRSVRLLLHLERLSHSCDMTAFIAFCGSQQLAQKFNLWPFVAAENRFRG